jgi:hypothetical protein
MKKLLVWGSVIVGIAFLALAIFYWITPADALPTYLPGYDAASTTVHFKHGLASMILAVALFIFAWFSSAPEKR